MESWHEIPVAEGSDYITLTPSVILNLFQDLMESWHEIPGQARNDNRIRVGMTVKTPGMTVKKARNDNRICHPELVSGSYGKLA